MSNTSTHSSTRRLTEGDGVTVELFKAHGIVVCGESDVENL